MAVPFRIGVMQLTMEPLDEMLESARVDGRGRDGHVWLAEAYPWWRKHQMEARSLDGRLGADGARDGAAHDRLGDHLAVHAPPGAGRDGRAGRAGGGRARAASSLGFGTSKIFLNNIQARRRRRRSGRCATRSRSCAASSAASRSSTTATRGRADVPALSRRGAHAARTCRPSTSPATAPKMQALARRDRATGCLTPSITTPAFVRYTRENVARRHRHRLHDRRLDPRDRPRRGPRRRARDRGHVPREQGAEHPGLGRHAARPRRASSMDEIRPGRRGDGAGRAARREGEGDGRAPRQVQADRRHARPTASRRSRSTATPAARTSCSSSGASAGTSRSGSSARRCSRTSAMARRDGDRVDRTGSSTGRAG